MVEHDVKIGLLDYLQLQTGCTYLTDLHNRKNLLFVQSAVRRMGSSLFPLAEWNDAVRYITGEDVEFLTCEEAAQYILSKRLH